MSGARAHGAADASACDAGGGDRGGAAASASSSGGALKLKRSWPADTKEEERGKLQKGEGGEARPAAGPALHSGSDSVVAMETAASEQEAHRDDRDPAVAPTAAGAVDAPMDGTTREAAAAEAATVTVPTSSSAAAADVGLGLGLGVAASVATGAGPGPGTRPRPGPGLGGVPVQELLQSRRASDAVAKLEWIRRQPRCVEVCAMHLRAVWSAIQQTGGEGGACASGGGGDGAKADAPSTPVRPHRADATSTPSTPLSSPLFAAPGADSEGDADHGALMREADEQLSLLEQRLTLEHEPDATRAAVLRLKSCMQLRQKRQALQEAQLLCNIVAPFDVYALVALLQEQEAANREHVQGADIALMIGATGAGKSTTIQWLAASDMEECVESNGLPHIRPRRITNPAALDVHTSSTSRSVTRFLRAVPVTTGALGSPLQANRVLVLVDAPGLADTRGAEIDVANSISILQAVQRCASVRLVVFVSFLGMGDRGEGVRELARMVSGLVRNVEDVSDAITFVFTHCPKAQHGYPSDDPRGNVKLCIYNHLLDIAKQSEDDPDHHFKLLLDKMVEATDDDNACIIDPLASKKVAAKFLNSLHKTKPITDSAAFQMFSSGRSVEQIQKQVDRLKLSIHAAIEAAEPEVALVQFRLEMLLALREHSAQPIAAVAMGEMLGLLERWLRRVFDECSQRISDMRAHSHITASQVQACVRDIDVLLATEPLAAQLGERCVRPQALLQEMAAVMRDDGAMTASLATNDVSQSESALLYLNDLRVLIEGLGGAGSAFEPLARQLGLAHRTAVEELLAAIDQWRQTAGQAVAAFHFDSFCAQLARIAPVLERFHAHIPVADRERVSAEVAAARVQLVESLVARVNASGALLQQLGDRDAAADAMIQLQRLSALLHAATNSSMLELQLGKETLLKLARDFAQRCVARFEAIVAEVEAAAGRGFTLEIFTADAAAAGAPTAPSPDQSVASPSAAGACADKSSHHSLEQIEPLVQQLQQLQMISGVELLVAPTWHRLVQRVLFVVKDARHDAEELLRRLSSPSDGSDRLSFYTRFVRCINVLRGAKWVESLQSGVCEVVLGDIFAQVEQHADGVCRQMERLDLSVERGSLADAVDCVHQVDLLQPLEGIILELGERRKKLYATFEDAVKKNISQLMQTFDLQKASVAALHERADALHQLRLRYAAQHPAALLLQQHGLADVAALHAAVEAAHKAEDAWKAELIADVQQRCAELNRLTQLNARIVALEAAQSARAEGMGVAAVNLIRKVAGQAPAQTEEAAKIHEELNNGGFASTKQLAQAQRKQQAHLKTAESKGKAKQDELRAEHQRLLTLTHELTRLQSVSDVTEAESSVLRDSGFSSVGQLERELSQLRGEARASEEQGLTHVMTKLDVEWAERALGYVWAVGDMPWKHEWLGDSKDDIGAYLQCYVDQLCKAIHHNLKQTVKPTARDGSYRHLFGLAQQVLEGGKELEAAAVKPRLTHWFKPALVSDFKALLSRHLEELRALMDDMSSTRKTVELEVQLSIAQALHQLDPFIDSSPNFAELYRAHRTQLGQLNSDVLQTSMKNIEANNFAAIASELGTLAQGELQGQAQFVIRSVQQPLSTRIQDLISELNSRIAVLVVPLHCHTEAVHKVAKALKLLQNAKLFVSDYLNEPVKAELEKACIDVASRALCTKMRASLNCIKRSLDANNFREAEQMLQSLQTVHELLASYCGDVQSDVEAVRASFSTKLNAKVRYWEEMSLAQYLSDPPKDILEKLKLMADSDGTYGPSLTQLKDAIRNKFQQELNEARAEKTPALRNRRLRLCQSVLRVLPKFLRSFLQLDLDNLREEVDEEEKASESELTNAIQLKDYSTMRTLMETFKSNGVLALNARAHESVVVQARKLKMQVEACLSAMQSDIHKQFECMQTKALKLQQLDGELGSLVPAVRATHRQTEERIKFTFESACEELRKLMMHHGHQLSAEVRDLLERNLVIFTAFCAAGNASGSGARVCDRDRDDAALPSRPSLFSALASSSLVQQTEQHLHSFLHTQEERFRTTMASQPLQIAPLKEALDAAKLLTPFHVKLRDYTMTLRPPTTVTMRSAAACGANDGTRAVPMEVDGADAAAASPDPAPAAVPAASKSKKIASRKSAAVAPAPAPAAVAVASSSAVPLAVPPPVPVLLLSVLQREAYTYGALQSQVQERLRSLATSVRHSIQDSASHVDPADPDFSTALKQLQLQLSSLKDAGQLQAHVQLDSGDSYADLCAALRVQLDELFLALHAACAKQPMVRSDFDVLRLNRTFLTSHAAWVHVHKAELKAQLAQLDESLLARVDKHMAQFNALPILDAEPLAKQLIEAKTLGSHLPWLKDRVDSKLDDALAQYTFRSRDSPTALSLVGLQLEAQPPVGILVIEEHGVFQGFFAKLFFRKVHAQDIHYTLHPANLKGDDIDTSTLSVRFIAFDEKYQALLKKYYFNRGDVAQLIQECKDVARDSGAAKLAAKLSRSRKKGVFAVNSWWTQGVRSCVPSLLAHLCALWSVHRSANFSPTDRAEGCWVQPLAPQVIAIFRLLGCDQDATVTADLFKNNLCQILTGEGKSVTLAMVSMILALLGARVSCACYSAYLSARDLNDFLPMFTELGVHEQIHYGNFNEVCERFINGGGDVRQAVVDMITEKKDGGTTSPGAGAASSDAGSGASAGTPAAPAAAAPSGGLHILLIDEVDVLFQEGFFGNVYTPLACLKHASIVELVRDVWSVCQQPNARPSARSFQCRPSFQAVLGAFPQHGALLGEALKDMLNDAQHFEHDYEVRQGQIAYREHDGYSTTASIGYKTMFAAMHHDLATKEEYACINLHCGSFSYAQLPLYFDRVMGVTGTLTTLSEPEKKIVRDTYHIHKQTIIPSSFGANQRSFAREGDGVKVENADDWHNAIKTEIEHRGLAGASGAGERAALVCFESEEKLEAFRKSTSFALLRDRAEVLTEATPSGDKERIVQAATHAGSITLFTRPFGRGTDFKCRDPAVMERGGVHMIQTFLAESLSEETQLQGRCARQGDKGSYCMVLLDSELEKFDISGAEIVEARSKNSLYTLLHEKREALFLRGYANRSLLVANARDEHEQAVRFLSQLRAGDVGSVSAFLLARNRGTLVTTSRTIVAMDATYSMSSLLQQAKITVGDTFQRAAVVLQEAGLDPQCFELQFVVYRNYNAKRVLEASSWESKANHLRAFIDRMEADGGMGPEAIEIALQHCNNEADKQEVAQVILIGDAPANSASAVAYNRNHFLGDAHWTSLFGPCTDWKEQLQRLAAKQVRVHTFPLVGGHLEADCSANFKQIASQANGQTAPLDVRDPQSSQQLTDLLTESVLQDAGREKGGELVAAYRAKFGHSKSYKR